MRIFTQKLSFKKPDKKSILLIFVSLMCIPILFVIFKIFGIIFTYTGSVPIGFYHRSFRQKIHIGDYVALCLPDPIAKMGLSRGYINSGKCFNGSDILLKEVIAVPGDRVTVHKNTIEINHHGIQLTYIAPTQVMDKNGLLVFRFIKNGVYKAKGYWVYGNGASYYSWDSRYYGGIPIKNIRGQFKPLLRF